MSLGLPNNNESLGADLEWENYREVPVVIEKVSRTRLEKSHLLSCFGGTLVFAAFGSSPGSLRRGLTSWLLIVGGKKCCCGENVWKKLTLTL